MSNYFIFQFFSNYFWFLFHFLLINRSNHFLVIGIIFFNSCSSNILISFLDTIVGLWSSSSISLLIFSLLSFNSLSVSSVKYFFKTIFLPLKIVNFAYFLSISPHYFRPYYLGFPSLYIHKNLLKNLWKQNIIFKLFFSDFMLFCYSDFTFLYININYIFTKIYWKNLWKQNVVFK